MLLEELRSHGVPLSSGQPPEVDAFPVSVAGFEGLSLDLASPALLDQLDPQQIGAAVLDPLGFLKSAWGLAKQIPHFSKSVSILETEIAGLLERDGTGAYGALYLDGVRYFSTQANLGQDTFVLVVNANDERSTRRQASRSWREANTLKRLGKALTMNQTTQHICVAAIHELASSLELAGGLIWVADPGSGDLRLIASVGVNKSGSSVYSYLALTGTPTSLPELVAQTRKNISIPNVGRHLMASNLEARFCYLKPGAIALHPLIISENLLGVVELIGKEGDANFEENAELFETISEHLALALNSAALFEVAERGALHDALTGIPNHRAMQEFLTARLLEAERLQHELAVVMIDVDHFRSFNEEEGHDAGDAVLKMVADALRGSVRPYDMAARYGGEEFTLVLPGAGLLGAKAIAERARQAVEALRYQGSGDRWRHITVSLGCAVFPMHHTSGQALLKAADQALYQAKKGGRNRVSVYDPELDVEVRPAIALEDVYGRLRTTEREAGKAFVRKFGRSASRLGKNLGLNEPQLALLQALLAVAPTYFDALHKADVGALTSLEEAPELRVLRPHMEHLAERYDGSGPRQLAGDKISLIARIAQVAWALSCGKSAAEIRKANLFDAELVSGLNARRKAA